MYLNMVTIKHVIKTRQRKKYSKKYAIKLYSNNKPNKLYVLK